MKNWKKIGQSIATGAGAALLASFANLLAPTSEARAFTLKYDEDGVHVTRIEGLSVGEDTFNVDFINGTFEQAYGVTLEEFDFFEDNQASELFNSIQKSLGAESLYISDSEYDWEQGLFVFDVAVDYFFLPFLMTDGGVTAGTRSFFLEGNWKLELDDLVSVGELGDYVNENDFMWAVWSVAEAGDGAGEEVSTPEPSLIFGLTALGGLMLGSNARKNKS
ncbi:MULTISPECIES: hypothetical protein [unclassified Okeania]|uniref:hypothetical protein n=1 Tax=unclassified Okeania TaxID=2634635 RepID=UPI00142D1B55|nr:MULTISPECIES: hypothetical protein [unclassified Okeania]NES92758.1 hypothetical protein [Okeania sp. SIO2B9]NET80334.1 hypothetical protein [Okeania sp. SIO1F9]